MHKSSNVPRDAIQDTRGERITASVIASTNPFDDEDDSKNPFADDSTNPFNGESTNPFDNDQDAEPDDYDRNLNPFAS